MLPFQFTKYKRSKDQVSVFHISNTESASTSQLSQLLESNQFRKIKAALGKVGSFRFYNLKATFATIETTSIAKRIWNNLKESLPTLLAKPQVWLWLYHAVEFLIAWLTTFIII